ncbi:hypothetical protein Pint_31301 [Pistacia integerrima]|uniref:Uncharacterized protein n=1 Tax=Pistacia integerrima TaxID=434235 RepID=A0ACC0XR67_9ROSI|nr:hypothetical protein Pint_31301 [Pistacia integerrima]
MIELPLDPHDLPRSNALYGYRIDWGENYKLPNIPQKDLAVYKDVTSIGVSTLDFSSVTKYKQLTEMGYENGSRWELDPAIM